MSEPRLAIFINKLSLVFLVSFVCALILPATFTLTDFVKSLELGSTPVQTPSSQFPTPSPIVPF